MQQWSKTPSPRGNFRANTIPQTIDDVITYKLPDEETVTWCGRVTAAAYVDSITNILIIYHSSADRQTDLEDIGDQI